MTDLDNNSDLAEHQIDRQLRRRGDGGDLSQSINASDPRMSSLINWVWATIGALVILIGLGVYSKLSDMNDTLIRAVAKLDTQADQIKELKEEVAELRAKVYSLEGKTLRGIQEMRDAR